MELKSALETYKARNAAEKLIIGYADLHKVYGFVTDFDTLLRADVCKVDGDKIRFKPKSTACMDLTWLGGGEEKCFIMDETEFNALYAEWKTQGNSGNKGNFFEWYVCKVAGVEYVKDNTPWWIAPDVTINGIGYQVKFINATVLEENHLEKCNG